jgi:hypothetical protein
MHYGQIVTFFGYIVLAVIVAVTVVVLTLPQAIQH